MEKDRNKLTPCKSKFEQENKYKKDHNNSFIGHDELNMSLLPEMGHQSNGSNGHVGQLMLTKAPHRHLF